MGDEHCVIPGIERAFILEEIQQVRHLLEIRRDIRVVARKMHVVELDVHHVLDLSRGRIQLARLRLCRARKPQRKQSATKVESCSTKQSNKVHLRFILSEVGGHTTHIIPFHLFSLTKPVFSSSSHAQGWTGMECPAEYKEGTVFSC